MCLKPVAKLGIWSLMPKVNLVWKHFLEELFWSAAVEELFWSVAEASLVMVKHVAR
jgi:hypothetical protein